MKNIHLDKFRKELDKQRDKLEKIRAVKEALIVNEGKSVTSTIINTYIRHKYPEMEGVGTKTIDKILRYDLHHSYKKAPVTSQDLTKDEYDQYREWYKVIFKYFVEKGCHFIWIDEVAFSSR